MTAAPGPRLRVLGTEAGYIAPQLDTQEDRLRAGAQPAAEAWGAEPQSHWGRLVAGDYSIPIRSQPGGWPAFYALLAEALRTGGPPPVDPPMPSRRSGSSRPRAARPRPGRRWRSPDGRRSAEARATVALA